MTHVIHTPRTLTRLGLLFAAALLCLMTVFGVSSAQAHDELISSSPASGDVLKAAPKSLVLTFSGDIKKIGTILELTDDAGKSFDSTFAVAGREVTVTPTTPLINGSYVLDARVVSSDGHPINKEIAFEVKDPAAAASSAPATASAPAAEQAPAAPAPEATEDSAATEPFAGMPAGLIWTIAGVAVIGMVLLVLLKVRGQNK